MSKSFYIVRIEHSEEEEGRTDFKVFAREAGLEMIAFDSTPAVIAFLWAQDPAEACSEAWRRAKEHFAQARHKPIGTMQDLLRVVGLIPSEPQLPAAETEG